jgi:hypothetical protein
MDNLIITPKTKIYDLLNVYPQLEDILIGLVPEFKKLKNPLLRKTITRITSIAQAATIGNIHVEELVNKLREEVGQNNIEQLDHAGNTYLTICPEWFSEEAITNSVDIREMLNAGEQPVHEVLSAIRNLGEKDILKVVAPFIPAPLIDKSLSMGYLHWLEKKEGELFHVYFKH